MTVALLLLGCSNEKTFKISGNISNFGSKTGTSMIYLKTRDLDDAFVCIDSTFVKNDGSFTLKGKSSETDLFFLTDKDNIFFLRIFVEKGAHIKVNGSTTDFQHIKIEGSKTQTLYDDYLSSLTNIEDEQLTIYHNYSVFAQDASISEDELAKIKEDFTEKLRQLEQLGEKITLDFVSNNPNSVVAAYLVYKNALAVNNSTEIEQQLKMLEPAMNNKFVTLAKKHLEKLKQVERGKVFPNIELPDIDGNTISLESLRGKYVLVDFWATWCGPCIGAIPDLKMIYQKYHNRGFEIYSVSLDQTKEAWVNGVQKYGLDWINVSDLMVFNSPVVKQLVVTYIPHTFLLDPAGVIIAVDISGEELETMLLQAL